MLFYVKGPYLRCSIEIQNSQEFKKAKTPQHTKKMGGGMLNTQFHIKGNYLKKFYENMLLNKVLSVLSYNSNIFRDLTSNKNYSLF